MEFGLEFRMRGKGSFRRHLVLTFLLVSLVPVAVLATVFLGPLGTWIEADIRRDNHRLVVAAQTQISRFLHDQARILSLLSRYLSREGDAAAIGRSLDLSVNEETIFDSILLIDADGSVRAVASRRSGVRAAEAVGGQGLSRHDAFARLRDRAGGVWSDVSPSVLTGSRVLTVAVAHGDGLLLGEMPLRDISSILRRILGAQDLGVSVIDRAGAILYDAGAGQTGRSLPADALDRVRRTLQGHRDSFLYTVQGRSRLGSAVRVPETGWIVLLSRDADRAFAPLREQLTAFAVTAVLAIVLAVALASVMSVRMARPLDQLVRQVRRTASGDYGPIDGLERVDGYEEFRTLAAEFQVMHRNVLRRDSDLRESEDRVRLILESVGEGILGLDGAGVVTFANGTAATVLQGRSPASLVGHAIDPALRISVSASAPNGRTDAPQPAVGYLLRPMRDGQALGPLDACLHLPAGPMVPVEVRANPILRAGEPVGVVVCLADLSARQCAEAALRESERRFRQIADLLPIAIALHAPEDGHLRYVNRAFCSMFGCTPETVHSLRAGDLYAGSAADGASVLQRLDRGEQVTDVELRLRRPGSGEVLWAAVSLRRTTIEGEDCVLSGMIDLTRHKEAERAVLKTEQRFKAFIDNAPAAMAVKDVTGRYLQVNQTFRDWYLNTARAADGLTAEEIHSATRIRSVIEDDHEVIGSCTVIRRERRLTMPGGDLRSVIVIKFPILRDGVIAEIGVIVVDISEQRRMKAELDKVYRAIEQSRTSIVITDANGTIEYVNPATEAVTEYGAAELIGGNPRLLRSGYTDPAVYRDLWACLRDGGVWQGEFHNRRKSGALFWELATISPVQDEDGRTTHYVAVKEDITERKRSQLELEIARAKAEAANEAKSHFLMVMSHELRTPLNSIIGFSEILTAIEGVGPQEPVVRDYAGMILESGNHLLDMINDILDLSKIDVGRYQIHEDRLDLEACVQSSLNIVRGRADRSGVALEYRSARQSCPMRGDPRALRQVLINLLSNAVKFTEEGGVVRIDMAVDSNAGIVMTIRDTGIGMTEEEVEKALLPFVQIDNRLNRRYQGSGLGLPLARALILAHGGLLEITSEPDVGTTVVVRLPPERLVE